MRFDGVQDQRKLPLGRSVDVGPESVLLCATKNGVFRVSEIKSRFSNGSYFVPMPADEVLQLLEVVTVDLK